MPQIRAIVIQPRDLVFPSFARGIINNHWVMARDWIEFGIGVPLNWEINPTWLVASWSYAEMADEARSPTENVAGKVLNWMNNSPDVPEALRPGGSLADQSGDTWTLLVEGAGGWAGAWQKQPSFNLLVNLSIVGSLSGPILGANGLPSMNDCHNFFPTGAWQCEYGTAFGTLIHETSHAAFGLDHDGLPGDPPSVMNAHWLVNPSNWAEARYIPRHVEQAKASAYVIDITDPPPQRESVSLLPILAFMGIGLGLMVAAKSGR